MVPDAMVWNVLRNLMVLDGERLSYRTLDVEQIGSVYEAIMGFRIELTTGRSIAVRSQKRTGAAVIVDLNGLLTVDGGKRAKVLQDATDQKLTGAAAITLRDALEPADIVAALDRKVDRAATPDHRAYRYPDPATDRRTAAFGQPLHPALVDGADRVGSVAADIRPSGAGGTPRGNPRSQDTRSGDRVRCVSG